MRQMPWRRPQVSGLRTQTDVMPSDSMYFAFSALISSFLSSISSPVSEFLTSFEAYAAREALRHADGDLAVLLEQRTDFNAVMRIAVFFGYDEVLRDVDEAARQVAGLSGTQSRVGESLSGSVRGYEVFQRVEPSLKFAVIG